MPRFIDIQPGGEKYLAFALSKLRLLKAWMKPAGLRSMSKHYWVNATDKIWIKALDLGNDIWWDWIRIEAGVAGGVAVLLDAAQIPGIDTLLLDAVESDFGLVLPKDTPTLPDSFKAGGFNGPAEAYRGMIVNHKFEIQYPTEYAEVQRYLTPTSLNLEYGIFRYIPKVAGGTALIVSEFASGYWASLVWIAGAETSAGADLDVKLTLIEPYDVVDEGGQLFLYAYADSYSLRTDGVVGVGQVRTLLAGTFPSTARLILYRRDAIAETAIETSGSADTLAVGIPARQGDTHYLAASFSTSTPASTLALLGVGETVFSESFSSLVSVFGAKVSLFTQDDLVQRGFIVPYQVTNGPNLDLYARSHLGAELLLAGSSGVGLADETNLAISSLGTPAIAFWRFVDVTETAFVKVWGTSLVEIGAGKPACAWSPDGKYLFVVVGAALRVFSSAGVLLHTDLSAFSPATSSQASGFFVESGYKLTAIWLNRVQQVQVTIVEDPFSVIVGSEVNLVPLVAGVTPYQWGVDDTRRLHT